MFDEIQQMGRKKDIDSLASQFNSQKEQNQLQIAETNLKIERMSDRVYEMNIGLKEEIREKADMKSVRELDHQVNRKLESDIVRSWIKEQKIYLEKEIASIDKSGNHQLVNEQIKENRNQMKVVEEQIRRIDEHLRELKIERDKEKEEERETKKEKKKIGNSIREINYTIKLEIQKLNDKID